MICAVDKLSNLEEIDMSNRYCSAHTGLKDEAALLGVFFVAASAFLVAVMCDMLR
jgi:hypothetical protein